MLDPKNWLAAIVSLLFGFGLWCVTIAVICGALYGFVSPALREHPFVSLLMAKRRMLTFYVAAALFINLQVSSWFVSDVAYVVMAALYAICVFVVIPVSRRSGKVIPH